ncbi:DSF synthase [Breoghania corrubedonensis]|uniref:DSF synthase n=1 Tax=Breoghania corrubedonensis TaxID=665038 RepID=A0A2T5VIH0_9HYPH|nr:crotonase/enoyl-CoA hydratase family protein [Breoghania corrubedonensis]PTW63543.1 DSF synthase [Breoghania corrubedonensis]
MTALYRPDGTIAMERSDVTAFPRSTMQEDVASEHYGELDVRLDPRNRTYWCMLMPQGRPSFTPGLLADLARMQASIPALYARHARSGDCPMRYFVVGSKLSGIFNLGGDLGLFAEHIRKGNRDELATYARACIKVVYNNAVNYELPIVTIALVQGDALGGGFEAALSCDVIIAERRAKFGLPEVLFNMFPGMGAYSFLARRLGSVQAERMILSGKLFGAEELHDLGIVDVLVDDGKGRRAVEDYIHRNTRRHNSHSAIYRTRRRVNPVTYEELSDIIDIWVDTALQLKEVDLRKMMRLTMAQDRRRSGLPQDEAEAV